MFPAICLADELKSRGNAVIFATDKRGIRYLGKYAKDAIVQNISTTSRLRLYISLAINILKYIPKMLLLKPRIVIGFGGYPSVPFVIIAQILGIKTAIHEQNAVIGKANILLSKKATIIATSFPNTKGLPLSKNVRCVGNPTRFEALYDSLKKDKNKLFTILIFGGSQGAKMFSGVVVEAICEYAKTDNIKVFHQGRKQDITSIKHTYLSSGVNAIVQDFFDNIGDLYQQSDMVISRAGASSVFEIIGFQKPSILIPYSNSINGDQLENAKFLESYQACRILQEKDLTKSMLVNTLSEMPSQISTMAKNLSSLRIENPVKKFADYIEEKL